MKWVRGGKGVEGFFFGFFWFLLNNNVNNNNNNRKRPKAEGSIWIRIQVYSMVFFLSGGGGAVKKRGVPLPSLGPFVVV